MDQNQYHDSKLNNNLSAISFISKILALSVFVVFYFAVVVVYTYIFARIQNSTMFFKFLDVVGIHSLAPVLSFLWLVSIPVLLVFMFGAFKKFWPKKLF